MTDRAALMAAILRQPDEDLPRLMYADEIEEHYGEPERAAFIRAQCELAREKAARAEGEWFCLWPRRRVERVRPGLQLEACGTCRICLLRRNEEDYLTTQISADDPAGHFPGRTWTRGFVSSVECPAPDWLAHADQILSAHPVAEVTWTTMPNYFYYLEAGGGWVDTDDHWGAFTDSPYNRTIKARASKRWPTVKTWHLPPLFVPGYQQAQGPNGENALLFARLAQQYNDT